MGKTYTRYEVERGLKRKGFVVDFNDHRYLNFMLEGQKTHIKTKVSHGKGGRDVSVSLLGKMADQCALTLQDFRNLLDCPLGEQEYGERVQDRLTLHSPPWSHGTRLSPRTTQAGTVVRNPPSPPSTLSKCKRIAK